MRGHVWWIVLLFMALAVPWLFTGESEVVLGLPLWAGYSLLVTVLFAAVCAFLLGRRWDALAGDPEESEPDGE